MKFEHTFGESVRKLREEKQLTLREVAIELGIDTSMLGKIEKNSRKPTKHIIDQFSKIFNVDGKDLTISFLSDAVVYQVLNEEVAQEVLKVAEKKVKYLKSKKLLEK